MKTKALYLVFFWISLVYLPVFAQSDRNFGSSDSEFSSHHLIIKFDSSVKYQLDKKNQFNLPDLDSLNSLYGIQSLKPLYRAKNTDTFILEFKESQDILNLVKKYSELGYFHFVEPNFIGFGGGVKMNPQATTPNDIYYTYQWGLHNNGSFPYGPTAVAGADIKMEEAWEVEQGDSSIIVAVLDSGLRTAHPEMEGRLWENPNVGSGGYQNDVNGYNFAYDSGNVMDDHGHGTNVTGIIGAKANNEIGFAGVDWHAKILTGKILDADNSGLYSWFAEAIYYAVDKGARVINMSVGGSGYSQVLSQAIDYAYDNDVTVVACMMNFNDQVTYYPAGFEKVIAVGSTSADDNRSAPFFWDANSGSNYGSHIDVVAPGNYIYGLSHTSDTNYNTYWGGTSQATPHVAGLCALLLAQDPSRNPEYLRTILRETAEDQVGNTLEDTPGFDIYYGYGRINAYEALTYDLSTKSVAEEELKIYPNPTADFVQIENLTSTKLDIFDLTGKKVLQMDITPFENISLNTATLGKGVFFLLFKGENETGFTKKLVVK